MVKFAAAIAAAAIAAGTLDEESFLDRRLTASTHIIYAPAGELRTPSDAAEGGFLARVARVAAVPFGFEADSAMPRPPSAGPVAPHEIGAATLREALDAFIRLDNRYEWRAESGMYVVRTRSAWSNPRNVLNQPVSDVDWTDLSVLSAFDRVSRLMYPDERPPFSNLEAKDNRPFSVRLQKGTLLDLLNAIVLADGQLGWSVRYGRPSDAIQFELTIGHYGLGPTHGWRRLPTGGLR
jgi:hypothetical protein